MTTPTYRYRAEVRLAEWTTLGVGGPARGMAVCADRPALVAALEDAGGRPTFVLGGGSNVLVADRGFDGWVLRYEASGFQMLDRTPDRARILAEAGLGWDALVARTVAEGLGGIEALSGIPGLVGAAPIQNIGAYGQELDETLIAVHVIERSTGQEMRLAAADCGFGYRTSRFKTEWQSRFVVVAIELELPRTTRGRVRYGDLMQRFEGGPPPSPLAVREAVLDVRATKSMVLDPADPNRRSAGSFFTNPVVTVAQADRVAVRADAIRGDAPDARSMPRWPQADGRVKLSAAWLIEAAGFRRGDRWRGAALSTRHVLALINPGGARARDLVSLAARIRRRVATRFDVRLTPEPVWLGFDHEPSKLLENPHLLEETP